TPESISSTSRVSDAASQQATASQKSPVSTQVSTPTSSSEVLLSEIKRHKTGAVLTASVTMLLIVAAAYGTYKLLSGRTSNNIDQSRMKISRLTTGGRVGNAVIGDATSMSPDGKYVVFTTAESGKQALWIRQVSTSSLVQIAQPIPAT